MATACSKALATTTNRSCSTKLFHHHGHCLLQSLQSPPDKYPPVASLVTVMFVKLRFGAVGRRAVRRFSLSQDLTVVSDHKESSSSSQDLKLRCICHLFDNDLDDKIMEKLILVTTSHVHYAHLQALWAFFFLCAFVSIFSCAFLVCAFFILCIFCLVHFSFMHLLFVCVSICASFVWPWQKQWLRAGKGTKTIRGIIKKKELYRMIFTTLL